MSTITLTISRMVGIAKRRNYLHANDLRVGDFVDKIVGMNEKTLTASLKRISNEVQTLLFALEGEPRPVVGKCPWCGDAIHEGEKVNRGIHFSPCYNFARDRVKSGETTWAALEADGKIGPKGKPGRKPLTIEEHRQGKAESKANNETKPKELP